MNCYTLEPFHNVSNWFNELTVVLKLVNETDQPSYTDAFMQDIFSRGSGARLAVHEPDTIPDLEKDTMHVEPGKIIEVDHTDFACHMTTNHEIFENFPPTES